jgi:type I restriction enzyme S subunit
VKTQPVQLGEVCKFVYGEALKEENRRRGEVPVYGSNGLVGWHDKALTRGATIIIGRKGSIGEVNWSKGPCFPIDTTYYVEKTERPCDLRWLYYTLLKLDLTRLNKSAAVPGLNRDDAYEQRIPFPDVPEQERITALLDQADRLVRTRRYALELTDTLLPATFLELFGDYLAPACSSVLNDVLALPLSNGFFEKNSVYGTGVPVIWVDNLYHTMTIDLENLRRARATAEQITAYRVMEGDLLFTRSSLVRDGIGQINIVPRLPEPVLFECHVIRGRVNTKRVNPFYVLGLYRSSFGKAHILRRANTATMTTISQNALEELPCPLPPMPLQQQFAALVERVGSLRAVQREALRQAEHLFASLLDSAFNADRDPISTTQIAKPASTRR